MSDCMKERGFRKKNDFMPQTILKSYTWFVIHDFLQIGIIVSTSRAWRSFHNEFLVYLLLTAQSEKENISFSFQNSTPQMHAHVF